MSTMTLLADINTVTLDSNPNNYVAFQNKTFFTADGGHGLSLWKTDGTANGTELVIDPRVGADDPYSIAIGQLTVAGNQLFFTADDGVHGAELWVSDGTMAGTHMVTDLTPGPAGSSSGSMAALGNSVLFSFYDVGTDVRPFTGQELWISDGTEAGTHIVKDINPYDSSSPGSLFNFNGEVYFSAFDGSYTGLWKSDGTEDGTVAVDNLFAGGGYFSGGGSIGNFAATSTELYFTAQERSEFWWQINPAVLYKTDGTLEGTVAVASFTPNSGPAPSNLTTVGDRLYFVFGNDWSSLRLWTSDGTSEGTTQLGDAFVSSFTGQVNGKLIFQGFDADHGFEVWQTDGSVGGTQLLADIFPGPDSSFSSVGGSTDGVVYFLATDASTTLGLYKTDGTPEGTGLVVAVPGAQQYLPLFAANGFVFFSAVDSLHGVELWGSDGTAEGTHLVKDVNANTRNADIGVAIDFNGILLFGATDAEHGSELWRSDGTPQGTWMVKDIDPGLEGSTPTDFYQLGDLVYFRAIDPDHGSELWVTDGTEAGTHLFLDINPGPGSSFPSYFTSGDGILYFNAQTDDTGYELWRSDGTTEGTYLLMDANPGPGNGAGADTKAFSDHTLYFTGYDGYKNSLWTTDGTIQGTQHVFDFPVIDFIYFQFATAPGLMTPVNGKVVFRLDDPDFGSEVWVSDGTTAGTHLLADIYAGGIGSSPSYLTQIGDAVFFFAWGDVNGLELWKTDGTSAGTALVKDINPGPNGSFPFGLINVSGAAFFYADDGQHGYEPWTSDGTEQGTVLAGETVPGPDSIYNLGGPGNPVAFNNAFYFTTNDPYSSTSDLWYSDGAQTQLALQLPWVVANPNNYLYPNLFPSTSGILFITTDDGIHGQELWAYSLNDPPTATDNAYGVDEDGALAGNLITDDTGGGADSDPNAGDTLSVASVNGSAANVGTTVALAHGNLTVNANGTFTYQPAANFFGTEVFTYSVADNHGAESAAATVTVNVSEVNDTPVANDDTPTTTEDSSVSGNVLSNDSDPDNMDGISGNEDTLTISAVNGSAAGVGQAIATAHGIVTVNGDGTFTYAPGAACDAATDSFTYTVSDGRGGHATATVTITINKAVADGAITLDGSGILRIGGTAGDDTIVLTASGGHLFNNGTDTGFAIASITDIRAWGRGGADTIDLTALAIKSFLSGGAGNDTLTGGTASDVILGGDGNDTISGGAGDDLLVGGAGVDRITGSNGSDVLASGDIDCGLTLDDLRSICAAWAQSAAASNPTVSDLIDESLGDSNVDRLTGGSGADLFIINSGDTVTDFHFGKPKLNKDGDVVIQDGVVVS